MSLCALMRLFSRHHSCIALHCFSCTSTSTSALFLVSVGELVPGPVLAIMTWQVYVAYEASLQFHAAHIKIVEVTEEDFVLTPDSCSLIVASAQGGPFHPRLPGWSRPGHGARVSDPHQFSVWNRRTGQEKSSHALDHSLYRDLSQTLISIQLVYIAGILFFVVFKSICLPPVISTDFSFCSADCFGWRPASAGSISEVQAGGCLRPRHFHAGETHVQPSVQPRRLGIQP